MREQTSIMNTNHTATSQAGQLVSLTARREQIITEEPFSDYHDYLEAMEHEHMLILARFLNWRQTSTTIPIFCGPWP
jgi:hypothetical protein